MQLALPPLVHAEIDERPANVRPQPTQHVVGAQLRCTNALGGAVDLHPAAPRDRQRLGHQQETLCNPCRRLAADRQTGIRNATGGKGVGAGEIDLGPEGSRTRLSSDNRATASVSVSGG